MSNVLSRIRKPSLRAITPCLVFAVIGAEYFSGPMRLREVPTEKTLHPAYKWLRAQDEISVIAEIPMDQVYDATWYQYHSTFHWKNLVNGYSGYLPKSYMKFARKMLDFPNTNSLSELQARQVDVVLVHGDRMRRSRFEEKRDHLRQVDAFPVPWEDKDTLIVQIPREKLPKAELSVRLTAGKYNYGFSGMKVLLENRETNLVCTTNALGWAYFPFLEPGRYVLRIDSGDGKSPGRELLVGTEDIREIIRLPLARPGTGALVLRVVDEKNKRPLQRVKITLTKERKTVKEDWDRNGLFIARYLEPGNYTVTAEPYSRTHAPSVMEIHIDGKPLVVDLPIPRR
jgi:hypothetical protein